MCCECGCEPRYRHHWGQHRPYMDFPPLISVEEEIKTLEELRGILGDRLDKVNKRLEALRR